MVNIKNYSPYQYVLSYNAFDLIPAKIKSGHTTKLFTLAPLSLALGKRPAVKVSTIKIGHVKFIRKGYPQLLYPDGNSSGLGMTFNDKGSLIGTLLKENFFPFYENNYFSHKGGCLSDAAQGKKPLIKAFITRKLSFKVGLLHG